MCMVLVVVYMQLKLQYRFGSYVDMPVFVSPVSINFKQLIYMEKERSWPANICNYHVLCFDVT